MNNRYLFRGKRVDNREWVTGWYFEHLGKTYILPIGASESKHTYFFDYMLEVDSATIGQCTGLLAAKSYRGDSEDARRVFEGDIVNWEDGKYGIKEIIFSQGCFQAHRYGGLCPLRYFPLKDSMTLAAEIIGTIHDHPELLGGEKGEDE